MIQYFLGGDSLLAPNTLELWIIIAVPNRRVSILNKKKTTLKKFLNLKNKNKQYELLIRGDQSDIQRNISCLTSIKNK